MNQLTLPLLVLLLVLSPAVTAPAAEPSRTAPSDDKADAKNLPGTWRCASATVDGKPLSEQAVKKLRLTLTADRYLTERGDEVLFDSTYRIDPAADPKRIEMIGTEGDAAGKPALGIYRLDRETLTICYTMPGTPRPKDFESKPGSGAYLITWARGTKSATTSPAAGTTRPAR